MLDRLLCPLPASSVALRRRTPWPLPRFTRIPGRGAVAEALGLAASVIAVVQIAGKVVSIAKRHITDFKDAPRELHSIHIEVSTLKAIFESLQLAGGPKGIIPTTPGLETAVEGCQTSMTELAKLLNLSANSVPGRWTWVFNAFKARSLLEALSRHKSTITVALSAASGHVQVVSFRRRVLYARLLTSVAPVGPFKGSSLASTVYGSPSPRPKRRRSSSGYPRSPTAQSRANLLANDTMGLASGSSIRPPSKSGSNPDQIILRSSALARQELARRFSRRLLSTIFSIQCNLQRSVWHTSTATSIGKRSNEPSICYKTS